MSKCISLAGEYSEHQPSEDEFVCGLCFAFDEDAAVAAIAEQRSRIAALEAVIDRATEALVVVQTVDGWVDPIDRARAIAKARETLSAAPSTVLDGMIREAKAEALEQFADDEYGAIGVGRNIYHDEMRLREVATQIRNGDA